jgi:paraquat-inducible protein A
MTRPVVGQSQLIICPDCDLMQRRVVLPPGGRAYCCRCHALLYREAPFRLDVLLAMVLAAIPVLFCANFFPVVSLTAEGARTATTLFGTALALWHDGMQPVALLVFFTAILVPSLELVVLGYLLLPLRFKRVPPGFVGLLRLWHDLHPWGMAEVYLMGVLVGLVKLAHMADVQPGAGLWSTAVLIVLLAAISNRLDSQDLWREREGLCHGKTGPS